MSFPQPKWWLESVLNMATGCYRSWAVSGALCCVSGCYLRFWIWKKEFFELANYKATSSGNVIKVRVHFWRLITRHLRALKTPISLLYLPYLQQLVISQLSYHTLGTTTRETQPHDWLLTLSCHTISSWLISVATTSGTLVTSLRQD